MNNKEAIFGGQLFVVSEDDQFLMVCDAPMPNDQGRVSFTSIMAIPIEGALLAKIEQNEWWLFIGGWNSGTTMRMAYVDDSPAMDTNAESLHAIGVPIVSIEEGTTNLKEANRPVMHVTLEERRKAETLARKNALLKKL